MTPKKSKKTEEELRLEHAEREMALDPYQEVTFNDEYHSEKAKFKDKYKGRYERLRQKLEKS
jgi:hypothetical protein